MSSQITRAFKDEFDAIVRFIIQQEISKFEPYVMSEPFKGDQKFVDYVGTTSMQQKMGRHSRVTYTDTPHTRRQITCTPWYVADLMDTLDKARVAGDPSSMYMKAMQAAVRRKIDEVIIAAARGTAYGTDGATHIVLPSSQKVAVGASGLSLEKLISALKIFDDNDIPDDYEKVLAIGPAQVGDLLRETEFQSSDYNDVKPLVNGRIAKALGFTIIKSTLVPKVSTSRYCVAWIQPGMALGWNENIRAEVTELAEMHFSIQFYVNATFGAARMAETDVVEIACLES